jgi:high affinity sulfate transporter 1
VPLVGTLRAYRSEDFRHDAVAAAVLVALLVPAALGYAELAGLPAVTGLYATIVPLAAYALLGPSPVLVLGPDSSLAPVIAATVAVASGGDPHRAVALAGLLALISGAVLVAGGALRLGFVMDLFSNPIRIGYLNGVALTVIVSQLPKLTGFSVHSDGIFRSADRFLTGLTHGQADPVAAAIGVGTLVLILVLRRFAPRAPRLLLAVAGATVLTWSLHLSVPVVGPLPRGLPGPALGGLGLHDVNLMLLPALGIALISFADTGILARALASAANRDPEPSGEMVALGAANMASGALGGFPISASATRTPVALASGARTQVTGLLAAGMILVLGLAAPGTTAHLPSAALAAVVVTAAMSLIDWRAARHLAQVRPQEFWLLVVAFAGVAVVGVLRGIGVAVAVSLLVFVVRAWRPHTAELVRVDGRKGYHDRERHPEGRRIPGLVIARFDAPLFFANAGLFTDFVRNLVDRSPDPVRWVVIAADPVTDIDTTAADALVSLDEDLRRRGVMLAFAGLKGPVKDRLVAYGLGGRFAAPDRLHPTLGTAVTAFLAATGTRWVDWSDRPEFRPGTAKGA